VEVLTKPAPFVLFGGQGDSSAKFTVQFHILDYGRSRKCKTLVWQRIWIHLEKAGIALATPRREMMWASGEPPSTAIPQTIEEALDNLDFLQYMEKSEKTNLQKVIRHYDLKPNDIIIKQGDVGDSLFVIMEGSVSIQILLDNQQYEEIARIGSGHYFGEDAIITGNPRSANVIAVSKASLFEIPIEHLSDYLKNHSEHILNRLKKHKENFKQTVDKHKENKEKSIKKSSFFKRLNG
jgi:branched-chain amino acid transport system substrate-binding protein